MKRLANLLILLPCLAGLGLAQDINYNFDENADFSKYKTYRWEKNPKSLDVDDLTLGQLAKGFEAALAAKGLTKAEGKTDLVIVFQVAMSQEKQMTTMDTGGYGYGPGFRGGWYGGAGMGGMSTTTTSTINVGSLVLDMYDTATKQLVWRGMISKAVDAKAKPEKRQKNIEKAAEKLMKKYPPVKKK